MLTPDTPQVLHVLRKYDCSEWGGAESHIAAVTREQANAGWHVDVFAPKGPRTGRGPLAAPIGLRRYRSFLPCVGPTERRANAIRHAGNIASFHLPWQVFRERPSIVHLHTGRRVGGAAALGARLAGRPFVISLHGPVTSDTSWLAAETRKRYRSLSDLGQPLGLLFGARSVLSRAARVICFNDDEARGLRNLVADERVVRMNHGVDAEHFADGQAERFTASHPELAGRDILLRVGRLCRQKNQLLAVDAFAEAGLDGASLLFAGSETDPGYGEAIVERARARGVADRVVLLGNVPFTDIPDLSAAARMAIVPSTQEAFGLNAVEAWAASTPALCALTAGLRPLANRLACTDLFVESDDAVAWGTRLRSAWNKPVLLREAGREARDLVRNHLSWSARTRELLTIRGRARLLGTRLGTDGPRGFFSPVEARVHLGLDYSDLAAEERDLLNDAGVGKRSALIARAALASLLGGKRDGGARALFGIEPANLSVAEALDFVFDAPAHRARVIHFAHPHALNISLVDGELAANLQRAEAVLADAIGVRLGTRLLGGSLASNLNGTDMFPLLCQRAAREGRPVVLIGARPDVIDACVQRMRNQARGLDIPVYSDGYLDDEAAARIASEIRGLHRPIVLVGMGSPIQEQSVWHHRSDLDGAAILTVDGLFDFYSGRMPRAPLALRELGLEWAYRLWREPRRMARRYLFGNPLFLFMVALQRLGVRPHAAAALPGTARHLE